MFSMKDGTEADDPRLGRLREFDERSRNFPIRAVLEEPQFRSYTWRQQAPPLNQGDVGACVAYSLGNEALSYPGEVALAPEFAARLTDAFLLRAYCEAQRIDPWSGTDTRTVCGTLAESPAYGGTSELAGLKVFQRMGFYKEYRWAFSLEDAVLGLGFNGPALVGSWWWSDMFRPNAEGFVKPTGSRAGGHMYMLSAVDVSGSASWLDGKVRVRNSWGPGWGDGGEADLAIRDLGKLLDEEGECAFVLHRTWKPHALAQPGEST